MLSELSLKESVSFSLILKGAGKKVIWNFLAIYFEDDPSSDRTQMERDKVYR